MKKLIVGFILTTLVTAAAFAEEQKKLSPQAAKAQAAAMQGDVTGSIRTLAGTDSNDVVVDGKVVGRDPDPNIRAMLRRDLPTNAP